MQQFPPQVTASHHTPLLQHQETPQGTATHCNSMPQHQETLPATATHHAPPQLTASHHRDARHHRKHNRRDSDYYNPPYSLLQHMTPPQVTTGHRKSLQTPDTVTVNVYACTGETPHHRKSPQATAQTPSTTASHRKQHTPSQST
ncbi:hypothetical protein BCV70DRAFT_219996 [Testicularia cyperi]|uniref:Uncharacterized protein n=1 Tax=Testicularia cyperi TaxID=1882483 RepID=A0A317XE41_9BASI|nr:hypothetical protein BCV70DRAFT_219996 [Testicularia cyperi]